MCKAMQASFDRDVLFNEELEPLQEFCRDFPGIILVPHSHAGSGFLGPRLPILFIGLNPFFPAKPLFYKGVCFHFRSSMSPRGGLLGSFVFAWLAGWSHLGLVFGHCFRTLLNFHKLFFRCRTSSFRCLCAAFFQLPGSGVSF